MSRIIHPFSSIQFKLQTQLIQTLSISIPCFYFRYKKFSKLILPFGVLLCSVSSNLATLFERHQITRTHAHTTQHISWFWTFFHSAFSARSETIKCSKLNRSYRICSVAFRNWKIWLFVRGDKKSVNSEFITLVLVVFFLFRKLTNSAKLPGWHADSRHRSSWSICHRISNAVLIFRFSWFSILPPFARHSKYIGTRYKG